MISRRLHRIVSTLAIALVAAGALAALPRPAPIPQPAAAIGVSAAAPAPRYRSVSHTVVQGDTAGSILRKLGAPEGMLSAAGSQLNRLSVGDRLSLDLTADEPRRLRLEHGIATILEIEPKGDRFVASARPIPYRITDGVRTLTVKPGSSLWAASMDAGLEERQISSLAEIYEYDVDFNTEIQPGDTIRMVAESLQGDDGVDHVGEIRAAELKNGKKTYTSIRYVMRDGTVAWFAPDGSGRRRPFLRSPLAFSRVTSNFTLARYHPILKRSRPHLGVDYGAPTGTAVRAVGDGVVKVAGSHGGHGNFVEIDHEGPYGTSYSHLSAILVKRGQKVRQGDIIGKVGATGLATGPHLHYQFTVDGRYTNPLTVDLPMTGSLPDAERDAFFKVRDAVLPMLQPT